MTDNSPALGGKVKRTGDEPNLSHNWNSSDPLFEPMPVGADSVAYRAYFEDLYNKFVVSITSIMTFDDLNKAVSQNECPRCHASNLRMRRENSMGADWYQCPDCQTVVKIPNRDMMDMFIEEKWI